MRYFKEKTGEAGTALTGSLHRQHVLELAKPTQKTEHRVQDRQKGISQGKRFLIIRRQTHFVRRKKNKSQQGRQIQYA